MSYDDILRMAEACGARLVYDLPVSLGVPRTVADVQILPEQLAVFAARIRAKTIEECACLCDIREREYSAHTSQTNRGAAIGAAYCAAAIRALGGRKPGEGLARLEGGHNLGASQG